MQVLENTEALVRKFTDTEGAAHIRAELGLSESAAQAEVYQALDGVDLTQAPTPHAMLAVVETRLPFYHLARLRGLTIDPAAEALIKPVHLGPEPLYAVWLEIVGQHRSRHPKLSRPLSQYIADEKFPCLATPFEGVASIEDILPRYFVALPGGQVLNRPGGLFHGLTNKALCLDTWMGRQRITQILLSESDTCIDLLIAHR